MTQDQRGAGNRPSKKEKEVVIIAYSQKAIDKWQAKNVKRYGFAFMRKTDAEIIAKLDSVPNKASYIRELIRRDIENSK